MNQLKMQQIAMLMLCWSTPNEDHEKNFMIYDTISGHLAFLFLFAVGWAVVRTGHLNGNSHTVGITRRKPQIGASIIDAQRRIPGAT